MNKHLSSAGVSQPDNSCIDELETLLNQIAEFRQLVKSASNSTDPALIQEYRLFKQYVEWKSEDLTAASYILTADTETPDIKKA